MDNIRNFCIIAHIDHGKSTLADRLLEYTKTVSEREMKDQLLDQMELEQERGITIKLQPVTMKYKELTLNLIDTPGHVDFTYEVSRSLAACEGALLVVDAVQGIQAQTLANVYMALDQNLKIIPVINKIDLPNADPARVASEITKTLSLPENDIILASAKTGEGVSEILEAVVNKIPSPSGGSEAPLRALIFDSRYDEYRGVQAFVRVVDGRLKKGDSLHFLATKQSGEAIDAGIFKPKLTSTGELSTGAVGYIDTGLKKIEGVRVGDTVAGAENVQPLPGYQEPRPVVYAGVYPIDADDYPELKDAVAKLKLNDAALTFEAEQGGPLGFGYRCGFLGLLHLEIVQERLQREYDLNLIVTAPSVVYKVRSKGKEQKITTPADLPDEFDEILEPWATVEIITPQSYLGKVMELAEARRGEYKTTEYLGEDRAILKYEIPLFNLIVDFYDKLKSVSSGYASLNYDLSDYRPGDLVRLDFLVNREPFRALTTIVHRSEVRSRGRAMVKKLKELIPRHQFQVPIQAAVGSDIIARETLPAYRKDVTANLYGGDDNRKNKLREKQKKGKKKMAQIGQVNVPQKVFLEVLKR